MLMSAKADHTRVEVSRTQTPLNSLLASNDGDHSLPDALPPRNAACYNTDGSFECDCASGWVWAEDSRECVDANECEWAIPRCDCNAVCNNTEGSYECLCQDGWSGKGTPGGCADIDECRQGEPCASRLCNNTSGSFVCVCPRGYEHLTSGQTCEQIDECVLNPCDEVANCTVRKSLCDRLTHLGPNLRLLERQQHCAYIWLTIDLLSRTPTGVFSASVSRDLKEAVFQALALTSTNAKSACMIARMNPA
mmetsp:Transcript_46566/g.72883  ORF Transcript_46566/g.72883 Transcript_46566/m.72883 type:complete len:250 (-) Transcript_46566:99-848(-)